MTDPIRAALEEAWEQSPSFLVTLPSGNRRTSLSTVETAEIIAVFLRALPTILDHELHVRPYADEEPYPDFDAIADAVIAAAKDRDND